MARRSAALGQWPAHLRSLPRAERSLFCKGIQQAGRSSRAGRRGEDHGENPSAIAAPWHMYSGVIVRCIIAASTLEGGKETAKKVLAAVAAHREEFEFDHHAGGANMDATPNQIIERLEGYSGVKLKDAFAIADLDREIKWHCRYARQNGIHVSPTFMIDGLVQADVSRGDEVATWVKKVLGH
ncbi:hypothetical protein AMC82_CH04092 [Rhizobium phaseoli]|nr:hypothetical protein AMC82_CH04092 [Rhizobium phaseoli]